MKKIASTLILAGAMLFVSNNLKAQTDEIQLIQSIWKMEKKALVTKVMKFTDAEGAAFWPIYESYQTELQNLGKDRLLYLNDYATNYATLTNEKADDLVKKLLKNSLQIEKLYSKYYKKFIAAITPIRAAQFMQLESYLSTKIRSRLQDNIPMIGEIEVSK